MNTLVSFETAKLLKEKGFDGKIEQGYYLPHPDIAEINSVERDVWILLPYNPLLNQVIAPTIAEVVMWLYDKHGVWIISDWSQAKWCYSIIDIKEETIRKVSGEKWSERSSGVYLNTGLDFKSPTEAYEAAIIYTLKNLL
jgi:hypothetical protein